MCIFNSQLFASTVISLHGPIWRRSMQSWLRAAELLQGNKLNSRKTERTWLNGPFPSHPLSHLPTYRTFPLFLLFLVLLHTEFLSPLSLSHLVPLSLSTFFLQSTTANFPRSPLLHYSPYRPHSRKQFPLQYVPILLPKEPARLSFPSTGLYQTLPSEQLPPLLYSLPTFLPSPIFLSPYPSLSKFQSQGHSTRYINLFPHPKLMYVSLPLSFSLNPSLPLLDFL